MPPKQLPTVVRQDLVFFIKKNLLKPPIYPQVVLKNVKWWGSYNIIWQMIPTVAHPTWKRKLTNFVYFRVVKKFRYSWLPQSRRIDHYYFTDLPISLSWHKTDTVASNAGCYYL